MRELSIILLALIAMGLIILTTALAARWTDEDDDG